MFECQYVPNANPDWRNSVIDWFHVTFHSVFVVEADRLVLHSVEILEFYATQLLHAIKVCKSGASKIDISTLLNGLNFDFLRISLFCEGWNLPKGHNGVSKNAKMAFLELLGSWKLISR